MISLVYSFVKKITSVVTLCLTAFFMLVLLTACPPTNNTGKKTTAINTLINIDSAALLGRLAIISSAEMGGRETGTPGNQRAREYITKLFDSLQLAKTNNSWFQPFPLSTVNQQQGTNIIGMIKGNSYLDNYIVITAHYDHLGTRNGAVYYGADDNASGTACLLTMAQYFKKHAPQHSLLFVAFDAEEKGLLGSKYFVAHSPVPLNTIAANINMDMVSRNDNNEIYACGIRYYPFLKKYVDSVAPHTPVHVLFGHDGDKPGAQDWTNQSDHYPFHINGVPFIYFGVEDHADYHRPSDTFDKVNKRFYYQTCTMITAVTTLIDQAAAIQ